MTTIGFSSAGFRSVGFIGLGAMGSQIAGRLLASGHQVYGTNRTAAKAADLRAAGLVWRDTPREVAAAADVLFSMVADDTALGAIAPGPDGLLAGLRPGTVYADLSTVSLAAQTLALGEGLLLAERGGIDPKLALNVMLTSSIGSPALQARGPLMLDLPEQAWFDIALMHKDIRLALDSGRTAGVPLPSARLADRMLETAARLGYAHRDVAALFDVLARLDEASEEARGDRCAPASAG